MSMKTKEKISDIIKFIIFYLVLAIGIVQIIFLFLKTTGVITWDWIYVFIPGIVFVTYLTTLLLVSITIGLMVKD